MTHVTVCVIVCHKLFLCLIALAEHWFLLVCRSDLNAQRQEMNKHLYVTYLSVHELVTCIYALNGSYNFFFLYINLISLGIPCLSFAPFFVVVNVSIKYVYVILISSAISVFFFFFRVWGGGGGALKRMHVDKRETNLNFILSGTKLMSVKHAGGIFPPAPLGSQLCERV